MCVLSLAFGYSSFFISSAIREAKLHPVASIIEIVDGKTISFPAVTILPGSKPKSVPETHLFRFVTSVLNNLSFGCPKEKLKSLEDYQDCLQESIVPLRKDFKPLLENMFANLEEKWKAEIDEGRFVKGKTIEQMRRTQNFLRSFTNIVWRLNKLSVTEDDEAAFRQKFVDLYPDDIAMVHLGQLMSHLEQLEASLLAQSNMTLSKEEEDFELEDFYKLGKLRQWLSILELLRADNSENVVQIGDVLEFSYLGRKGYIEPYMYTFGPNNAESSSRNLSDMLIDGLLMDNDDKLTAHELVFYLSFANQESMQGDFKLESGKRGTDCAAYVWLGDARWINCTKQRLDTNWKRYLRLFKYLDQPSFARVSGTGFERDMVEAFGLAGYKTKCNMTIGTCINSDPIIRHCNFGYVDSALEERQSNIDDCSYFRRTFGIHGLAYSFTSGSFWSVYRKNEWNTAFFEEIFNTENDDFEEDYFSSGKKLDFFIFPDSIMKYRDAKEAISHSLAIHHPTQFPGSSIFLEAGYR